MAGNTMKLSIKVWRQKDAKSQGAFETYPLEGVSPDMSFLEMIDFLNSKLVMQGKEPVHFEHDCREGICGTCNLVINGYPHGPDRGTTTCQLHMRRFRDGETITIEPFRAAAFPIIKDLVVDRSSLDRIVASGGFISARIGSAQDANSTLIPKPAQETSMDAAACIQCGACVAACPNASAMLFVGAQVSRFAVLPQGKPEKVKRVKAMVARMDQEGFGNCRNYYECEAACPKEISVTHIARMNREYLGALVSPEEQGSTSNTSG